MTFHTTAYTGSVNTGLTSYTDIPAVSDGVLVTRNSHLVFGFGMKLFGACAIGDSLKRARLSTSIAAEGRSAPHPANQRGGLDAERSQLR